MAESEPSLLDQMESAAEALQDRRALQAVLAARQLESAARLQILVVGSTGSGRASLVNAILERPDLLPPSAIPKAPVGLTVRYGSSESVEIESAEGMRSALSFSRLRTYLTGPKAEAGNYRSVEVRAPCDLLKLADIRVESLQADYPAERWQDLLAAADFTILVLNATALLSHRERQFVRQYLAEGYGLQRVAIAVNQIDLIPEEERASLLELVRTFLGPFQSQPAVLELSAATLLADLQSGRNAELTSSVTDRYGALRTLVGDLIEQQASLRGRGLVQALEMAVSEIEAGVARRRALLGFDQTEIDDLQRTIAGRREWLQERSQRAQRRVDTFVGTLIKEQLRGEIEGFGAMLRRKLPEEIRQIDDVAVIRRHLPGYIETVWSDFLQRQMIAVRSRLQDETRVLSRTIEADLIGLLGDRGTGLGGLFREFDPAGDDFRAFIMPKRGKHHASGVAKGLSLHGYIMLFFDPPLGILSLAASQIVRRMYQGGIASSDKSAIAEAAGVAVRELERGLQDRVAEQFGQLTGEIKAEIASLYREGAEHIEDFLNESMARRQEIEARAGEIETLTGHTLPRLRCLLEELDRRSVA